MTTKISMLAIDLAKGSFQICAVGADGTVLYNRVLSPPRRPADRPEAKPSVSALTAGVPMIYLPAGPVLQPELSSDQASRTPMIGRPMNSSSA